MLRIPALCLAAAASAFVAVSYGPSVLASAAESAPSALSVSGKGDRLALPRSDAQRRTATVIEIVGSAQPTIILRSRDGQILYRSDALTGTTLVAKDADLPMISVRETPNEASEPSLPVRQAPLVREDGPRPATARPVGCESALSPLARGAASATIARCLADAGTRTAS